MVPVTVGASNDTQTVILTGVSVGDQIITQTVKSTGSKTTTGGTASGGTTFSPGAFRALGGGGGFGRGG